MRLTPTDDQRMIREALARVLGGFAPESGAAAPAPRVLWRRLAEAGLPGLGLPEPLGGMGFGLDGIGLACRELGRAAAAAPFLECFHVADLVTSLAAPEMAAPLLAAMMQGEAIIVPALDEAGWRSGGSPLRATLSGGPGRLRLAGVKRLVKWAGHADRFAVLATEEGGAPVICLVSRGAIGVEVASGSSVDHADIGDLTFRDVAIDDADVLRGDVGAALKRARNRAVAAACADAAGAMERLVELTSAYVEQREQFGRKLSANQSVEHKIARMKVAVEEADGMALLATLKADDPGDAAAGVIASAKATTGRAARLVSQSAVQLHGGMGVSEEAQVHRYFRRLFAFEQALGATDAHLAFLSEKLREEQSSRHVFDLAETRDEANDDRMALTLSAEETAFRDEVRAFLDEELTPDLRRAHALNPGFASGPDVHRAWQRKLNTRGWAAPSYPKDRGGTGWTPTQAYIFATEVARAGAPNLWGQGLRMVGPVLLKYGTEAQKARFLPGILSGEDYWCQGYSEPGAGSDLAALKTRAVRDGDHYVINGSKIWTSHAHHADKIFCLVRTADMPKRQQGISFVVFDMNLPGITVQPIITMPGRHEVNQVFFDDVRIPAENLIGEENQGWEIAKYLLEFERGSLNAPGLRASLNRALKLAAAQEDGNGVALDSPHLAHRLARIACDLDAYEMMELSLVARLQAGGSPGVAGSIAKLRNSEIRQALSETVTDILGPEALRLPSDGSFDEGRCDAGVEPDDPVAQSRAIATSKYLQERAFTIFGGATEVQLTIIGRAVLARSA